LGPTHSTTGVSHCITHTLCHNYSIILRIGDTKFGCTLSQTQRLMRGAFVHNNPLYEELEYLAYLLMNLYALEAHLQTARNARRGMLTASIRIPFQSSLLVTDCRSESMIERPFYSRTAPASYEKLLVTVSSPHARKSDLPSSDVYGVPVSSFLMLESLDRAVSCQV
jgi:hypothetical protein